MEIQMNTKYQKIMGFESNGNEDAAIISKNSENKYYGLNNVALSIWAFLENPVSPDEIIVKLRSVYSVDEETCKKQVLDFMQELLKENIISTI